MIAYLRPSKVFRSMRRRLSAHPAIFFAVARLLGNKRILNEKTDIVLDGYPRCGNSFAEAALLASQSRAINVASHAHAAAQVIEAVRRGLPTVAIYRDPDDAVASYMDMNQADWPIETYYADYFAHYEPLLPIIDKIVLARFDVFTRDFSVIPRRLNAKFNLDLEVPEADEAFRKRISERRDDISTARIGRAPIYSNRNSVAYLERRNQNRAAMRERVATNQHSPVRQRAVRIFEKLCNLEDVSLSRPE